MSEATADHSHSLQKDARQSRDSLCYDPKALLAELEGVSSIKPPYLLPQIREDVFLAAIRDIYRKANCETQSIYALVGTEEDNWVIRWMLWNVIDELDPGSNQFQPTSHRLKSAPTPLPTSGISINNRKEKVSVDTMSSLHELFDFKHNQRPYYRCSRPRSSRKRSSLLPDYTRVWAPYPAPSSNKSYWDPVRDT